MKVSVRLHGLGVQTNTIQGLFLIKLNAFQSYFLFHKYNNSHTSYHHYHYIYHQDSSSSAVEEWGCVGPH
jgi:hypothetical protein